MQYEYQIGAPRLPAIRTHALYTGATHFPSRSDEVLVLDRPHESVLMCLLRHSMAELTGAKLESSPDGWPTAEATSSGHQRNRHPSRFMTSGFEGGHRVLGFRLSRVGLRYIPRTLHIQRHGVSLKSFYDAKTSLRSGHFFVDAWQTLNSLVPRPPGTPASSHQPGLSVPLCDKSLD